MLLRRGFTGSKQSRYNTALSLSSFHLRQSSSSESLFATRKRLARPAATAVETSEAHTPVLLEEVLQYFSDTHIESFVDGTLGAGGHSLAVLQSHPELKHYLGLDIDPQAHSLAKAKLSRAKSEHCLDCDLKYLLLNYSAIRQGVSEAFRHPSSNAILLDLGVSSMQIVNCWPESELGRIFRDFGEERHWRAYAARLVNAREKAAIRTTQQLCSALGYIGSTKGKRGKIHPATRIFQGLRIAVNDELGHLSKAIPECIACLAPKGRLAVITFHSLEDRIVKRAFLKASGKGESSNAYSAQADAPIHGRILTRKPVIPSEIEQDRNPRCRSAKLRIFEKSA